MKMPRSATVGKILCNVDRVDTKLISRLLFFLYTAIINTISLHRLEFSFFNIFYI